MSKTLVMTVVAAALVVSGCRKAEQVAEAPAHTAAPAPQYQVKLESGSSIKADGAPVDVVVLADGKPVTDAGVAIELRMPATASMGEMRTGLELKAAGDGHYRGQLDPGMTGKWTAIVRVTRGGQLVTTFSQPVEAVE